MPKITFIGAGSFGFTRKLVKDILTFPNLEEATICLMDIDPMKLAYIEQAVRRIVREGGYSASVETTLSREEALQGADYVIVTILVGQTDVWRTDIEIPKQYGIDTNIGDTRGPSGIFRAMRTTPVMVDIARDMERLCPDAVMLNYTNPMVINCRAIQKETSIVATGLCHSVQGTANMLARWIGAPTDEITYTCAGINHMAWYLNFEWNGETAHPLIRQAIPEQPKVYKEEQVRNEMYRHIDYYPTESSGHLSEYNPWFRKRPELIEKYCTHGTGWNPGEYAYVLKHYSGREETWHEQIRAWLDNPAPLDLSRGYEYAAYSTAMFDLAGIASNAELDADQSRALLEAYFGREPEGELVRSHRAMQCASLLREAMWSMVSEIRMTTPGVDYVAYTAENLRKLEAARAAYESAYGKVA